MKIMRSLKSTGVSIGAENNDNANKEAASSNVKKEFSADHPAAIADSADQVAEKESSIKVEETQLEKTGETRNRTKEDCY